jgi:DNA-binding MarR family transcriptional regulator
MAKTANAKTGSIQFDTRESIAYWVISTAHALERNLNEVLKPLGITFRQAEVLVCLAVEGTMSQAEVARRLGIEAPTLAGIVSRMERNGWIVREGFPGDRRKKLLRPAAKVEPLWTEIMTQARQVRSRASQGFDPERLRRLMDDLAAVQANLDGDSQPSAPCAPGGERPQAPASRRDSGKRPEAGAR